MEIDRIHPRRLRRIDRLWSDKSSFFLTLCTYERKPALANTVVHDRMVTFINGSVDRYGVWVDSYVLMPDHMHAIVTMSPSATTTGAWVKALKAFVARHDFRWQDSFFDHVLRSDESRSEKWEYIRLNPVRAGLVDTAEAWPYAGAFHPVTGQSL